MPPLYLGLCLSVCTIFFCVLYIFLGTFPFHCTFVFVVFFFLVSRMVIVAHDFRILGFSNNGIV